MPEICGRYAVPNEIDRGHAGDFPLLDRVEPVSSISPAKFCNPFATRSRIPLPFEVPMLCTIGYKTPAVENPA